MSSSTGKGLEQRGVWDVGGVDGGEGNRVGRREGGEGGSRIVGGEGGKNTTGLMGETGEGEACLEAGLLRELGGMGSWSGLDGDVQEWDTGVVALVNPAWGTGGVQVSSTESAGEGGFLLGCGLSAEGEPTGAGGRKSTWSKGEGQEKAAVEAAPTVGGAPVAGLWTLVCVVGDSSCEAAGTDVGTDGTS